MTEDDFFAKIEPTFKELGSIPAEGEEFREPSLDVLRYYGRQVRLHWLPILGKAMSVTAVARQPVDVGFSVEEYRKLLDRLGMAVNGRFPPWGTHSGNRGIALGLTAIILTPEPIAASDDSILAKVVNGKALKRQRAVPLGVLRVNLGQEAMAFALANGPPGVFSEPTALADAMSPHLRRFVPFLEV